MTNMGRRRDLGPKFLRFVRDSDLLRKFLDLALEFAELEMKNEALKLGRGSPDMVATEIQAKIAETVSQLSDCYLLIIIAESDYAATMLDQHFFEMMFKFTNKVLLAQYGRAVTQSGIALARIFRTGNFN